MALDGQLLAETEVTSWSNGYPTGSADGHCRSRGWRRKKLFRGSAIALRILQSCRLESEKEKQKR